MLSQYIRTINSDNGTLTDVSIISQTTDSTLTAPIVSGEDYTYIGQYLPSNNMFFEIDTANTNAAVIQIQYWDGTTWRDVVDILDGTSTSSKTLAQSGVIQWSINNNYGWVKAQDTSEDISALSTLTIYNLYWMRFSSSADLSSGSLLDRVTYKFTDADALTQLEPDLTNIASAWGVSDWLDQMLLASKHVWHELRNRDLIKGAQNILRFDDVYMATAYRTLAIIYDGLASSNEVYVDKKLEALREFKDLLSGSATYYDRNEDSLVNSNEIAYKSARTIR